MSITAKVTKTTEKYGADSVLFKSVAAEAVRLEAVYTDDSCKDALTTTIAKDKKVGDKKRKQCIAMDEDNQDVNECY